jgi:very-short-patch-repair endonuclease
VGVCGPYAFASIPGKARCRPGWRIDRLFPLPARDPLPDPPPFRGREFWRGGPMNASPRDRLGSSSLCKGEDRWGSAASRFSRPPEATTRARRLRRDATKAEKKLWYLLQRGQMAGLSFRRQHPLGKYIIDFYCSPLKLAIEVDGGQHNEQAHQAHDERRSQWLRGKGVTVLRFWNNDVLQNIEGVWDEIERTASKLSLRFASQLPKEQTQPAEASK